jgi:transketolase
MRVLPEVAIISPADADQAVTALEKTWDLADPIYYRLGKDDGASVAGLGGAFELGRAQVLRAGDDLAFLTMGSIASDVVGAADELEQWDMHASVAIVASVRPQPTADVLAILERVPLVLTVEAHSIHGGLGSMIAEIIAERNLSCRLVRCGVQTASDATSGANTYLNAAHGLSRGALVERALVALSQG